MRKGMWSPEEDEKLKQIISKHGYQCWKEVAKKAGLQRCGKSCRLRWINYLRPGLRRSKFSTEEKKVVLELHKIYGNRWTKIAEHLEGRTDNDVKNMWHSQTKMRIGKLNNQKAMLPNDHINLSSEMSRSSPKHKKEEKWLIDNNEVLMQPQYRPKIFPFILDLDNIASSSELNLDQQCLKFKHIDSSVPLLDISESSMHNLGVSKSYPVEYPIFSSFIDTNYSSLDVELGIDQESTMPFIHMVVDNDKIIDSGLKELEANEEVSTFHITVGNLTNLSNNYVNSLDVMASQDEDDNDESINHLFTWYKKQHTSELMVPNGILENINDDEGTPPS